MSVTIKDIAKLANVSHTTVSRALNDSPLINRETKEKIKAIAKQLRYTPNYSAKSLVLHRSYHIGLFFSTLNTGTSAVFFYEVVRGVNSVIKGRYKLIVEGIDDYYDYNAISKRSFDGIIIMSQSSEDNRFIRHVMETEIPLVVLNRRVNNMELTNIISDDRAGAFQLVDYLIRQGHRKIAIIEGKQDFQSASERKAGYLDALACHSIQPDPDDQVKGNYDTLSGYQAMQSLLSHKELPTAIFCSNDEMAVGAIKAVIERGLHVPNDISVVGFDDNVISGYFSPAITTIKRPIEKVSKEGAARLLEHIDGRPSHEMMYFPTELIVRDSVKNMNRDDSNVRPNTGGS